MKVKATLYSFSIIVFVCLVWIFLWINPSYYDKQNCSLRNLAIRGVVQKVQPGHEVTFTIRSTVGEFPMHFMNKTDPRDQINDIQPGEIMVTPISGDSILKLAFSEDINLKGLGGLFLNVCGLKTVINVINPVPPVGASS